MKRLMTLILVSVSGGMLSACASSVYTKPMAIPPPEVPLECRIPCLNPPATSMPREQWETAVFKWGADCFDLHQDCVDGNK